jgi:hypothetical protein
MVERARRTLVILKLERIADEDDIDKVKPLLLGKTAKGRRRSFGNVFSERQEGMGSVNEGDDII